MQGTLSRNSTLKLDFLFVCLFFVCVIPLFVYSFFDNKKASYIIAGYPVVCLPKMLLAKVVLVRQPSCSSKPVCYHTSVVLSCLITK